MQWQMLSGEKIKKITGGGRKKEFRKEIESLFSKKFR